MPDFDPNGAATEDSGIFGFFFTPEESALVLIPVPWEATTSYGSGCSRAPEAIFKASMFVELFSFDLRNFFEKGISLAPEKPMIRTLNKKARKAAEPIIKKGGLLKSDSKLVNNAHSAYMSCKRANEEIKAEVATWIGAGKKVGIIGGDHSVTLGSLAAYIEKYPNLGVLQIDAHADLREAFEGLTYSHASVMYNVLKETNLKKLVQVGVRGFCEEEFKRITGSNNRVVTYFDSEIQKKLFEGAKWAELCDKIISDLPEQVYISFDVDGLDPRLCPGTGTPIPGGLNYQQAIFLLKKLVSAGKKIVGFDLVEVSPLKNNDWDAILAAHLLYQLCGVALVS